MPNNLLPSADPSEGPSAKTIVPPSGLIPAADSGTQVSGHLANQLQNVLQRHGHVAPNPQSDGSVPVDPHSSSARVRSSPLPNRTTTGNHNTSQNIKQHNIPVTYEKFSSYENQPTILLTDHVPFDISSLDLRTMVLDLMELPKATNLMYSITGAPKPYAKPFATLENVEEALKCVRSLASRARTKVKGLKIINKDPTRKTAEFLAFSQGCKRKEKQSARKKRAEAEAKNLTIEERFAAEVLVRWPACSNSRCLGINCYVCPGGQHIALTHPKISLWAKEHVLDPKVVTVLQPPNHDWFDPKKCGVEPASTYRKLANRLPVVKLETKPEPLPKDEGISDKGVFDEGSAAFPICLDLDEPLAGASTSHSGAKPRPSSPGYIDLVSDSDSCSDSDSDVDSDMDSDTNSNSKRPDHGKTKSATTTSTRLPSPSEVWALLSPPIEVLFARLDQTYPDLQLPLLAPHLHLYGIRHVHNIPEHSVHWMIDNLRLSPKLASLIFVSAVNFQRDAAKSS
ncbi:hypothetical protein FS749_009478 [Ceratobasidium sp. UAMH 11750]|nr:hypothetical protein FS749_009478 [Ceratobasidium sp. UAMH 11750]